MFSEKKVKYLLIANDYHTTLMKYAFSSTTVCILKNDIRDCDNETEKVKPMLNSFKQI